ncbi:tyrosine-type recombinase/integrase [Paraburkholderia dinghuensis]|uniref:tyrosine-type recombinase/integrase n=1 Tax=Paraburkholderia dinghuensis TaxID=2305225 RepID=UPI0016245D90|nr:site-specific integrase [Paraburkholderia dinghuensis]
MGERAAQQVTEVTLSRLTAADDNRTVRDGSGLSGKVHAARDGAVSVHFRYRYRFNNRAREATLGAWPRDSLDTIRDRFEEIRLRVAHGTDPAGRKQVVAAKLKQEQADIERRREQQLTFADLYSLWQAEGLLRKDGGEYARGFCERHLLPLLGHTKLRDLNDSALTTRLRALIAEGKCRTALELHAFAGQVLRWGLVRNPWRRLLDVNPVELIDIDRLLPPDYKPFRERVLTPEEVWTLNQRFMTIREAWTLTPNFRRSIKPLDRCLELGVGIALATMVRSCELMQAPWKNVNLERRTWFIPGAHCKNKRAYTVFLSDFAVELLTNLRELTGGTPWLFPHRKDDTLHAPIKDIGNALAFRQSDDGTPKKAKMRPINSSLLLPGGRWSTHDLRRTGATYMQALDIAPVVIERCLNHVSSLDQTDRQLNRQLMRHYHQYSYQREMRAAWQKLGAFLEKTCRGEIPQLPNPDYDAYDIDADDDMRALSEAA